MTELQEVSYFLLFLYGSTAFELDCNKGLLAFFACHHILDWATFCAGLLIIGCQFVTEKRHQGCH